MLPRFLLVAAALMMAIAVAQGAPTVVFESFDAPLILNADEWERGNPEIAGVMVSIPERFRDFHGYDRLAVDYANEGYDSVVRGLECLFAGPSGNVFGGFHTVGGKVPSCGVSRWIMSIGALAGSRGVDASNVARLYFFFRRPSAVKLRIYRIVLLRKGEKCPPMPETFSRRIAEPLARAKEEEIVRRERRRTEERKTSAVAFAKDCALIGQSGAFWVGMATSMEKIRPLDGVFPKAARTLSLRLARGEKESIQVFVVPRTRGLSNVRVSVGELRSDTAELSSSNVSVSVLGYLNIKNEPPYRRGVNEPSDSHPGYRRKGVPCELGWWPDPLLCFLNHVDVAQGSVQGFWIRVCAPRMQAPGIYRGTVTVSADGAGVVELPMSVRVNSFEIPATPMLPLAVSFQPLTVGLGGPATVNAAKARRDDPLSPVNQWKRRKEAWCDFLTDHYLSFDTLYCENSDYPDFKMLERQRKSGLEGMFNLGYWKLPGSTDAELAKWRETTIRRLRAARDEAERRGMLDRAYSYGCDEAWPHQFARVRWAVSELRSILPKVPLMTTAYDKAYGVDSALDGIDCFVPQTVRYGYASDLEGIAKSRTVGRKVWWYFACEQLPPTANCFVEGQGIEMRSVMGAQAVKYRPDGFLYYHTAFWNAKRPIESGPFTDWEPCNYKTFHGDGCWTCCGPDGCPLSTIRLENFADGLEDYAYAKILETKLAAYADKEDDWSQKAKKILAVPPEVVDSVHNFTDNPTVLYRWRDAMADLIETGK